MRFGVGPIVRDESIENQISDCILPWGEKRERKKERKKARRREYEGSESRCSDAEEKARLVAAGFLLLPVHGSG